MTDKKPEEQIEEKQSPVDEKVEEKQDLDSQELKELLQRVQAEFENYKKRTEKSFDDLRTTACALLIEELLPIVDNFDLAIKHSDNLEDFKKGVELIYTQLKDLLKHKGLEKIEAKGKFNPYLHEAMMTVESDKEPGTIVEEFQAGYKLNGKVIRHTKVKVSK